MPNIAELQATVKIQTEQAEQNIKRLNSTLEVLNKKVREGQLLTQSEEKQRKQLNSVLASETREKNRLTRENEKLNRAQEKLTRENEKSNKESNKGVSIWGRLATQFTVASVVASQVTRSINFLTTSLMDSGREAILFQKNMSLSNTILDVSKDKINAYSGQIAQMGVNVGKAPSELAMGLYEVASSTDATVDRLHILELATKASVAGFTDVSTAVDAGIGMMNAFGLGVGDLDRIYDLQFKTVDRGIIKYGELKEALGNMMSSAKNAKVPMEEMLGQLAFLTKKGQNYAKASIALARTYDTVFEKGDKLKKYLDVDVSGANGKLRSTTDILADMANELAKYDEISQVNILEKIGFTDRASRGIVTAMADIKGVRKEVEMMKDSAGNMQKAFSKASDNIATDWAKMKAGMSADTSKFMLENETSIKSLITLVGLLVKTLLEIPKVAVKIFGGAFDYGKTIGDKAFFVGKIDNDSEYKNQQKEYLAFKKQTYDKDMQLHSNSLAEQFRVDAIYYSDLKKDYQKFYKDKEKNSKAQIENNNKIVVEGAETLKNSQTKALQSLIDNNTLFGKDSSWNIIGNMLNTSQQQFKDYSDNLVKMFKVMVTNSGETGKAMAQNLLGAMGVLNDLLGGNTTYAKNFAQLMSQGKAQSIKMQNPKTSQETLNLETKKEYDFWINYLTLTQKERDKAIKDVGVAIPDLKNVGKISDVTPVVLSTTPLKTFSESEGKKPYDFTKENQIQLASMSANQLNTSMEDYWKEYQSFLEGANKKLVEEGQSTKESESLLKNANAKLNNFEKQKELAKKDEELLQDKIKFSDDSDNDILDLKIKDLENKAKKEEEFKDIFKEEEALFQQANTLGDSTSSKDFKEKLFDIYDKEIENLIKISEGTNIYDDKIKEIKSMQTGLGIIPKKDKTELTPGQIKLNEGLSETANLVGALGTALEDDLLNALSNTINGIGSIVSLAQKMKIDDIGGLAGGLGIATAVVGIVSELGWFSDPSAEAQTKANEEFTTAVEKFQQAVDDMSIGEKISFAQMTKPSNLNTGNIAGSNISGGDISWGGNNASIDTSALQGKLSAGGYNIDTQTIMNKYAKREDFYNLANWGKKESRITGYDTAGAMAEINKLIDEAYKKNLSNFKTSLGLTTDSFASGLKSALEGGDIDSILTNMFSEALKTAFLNQKAFEDLYAVMGDKMTEVVLNAMGSKGKTKEELSKMNLQELYAYAQELTSTYTDVEKKAAEEAGMSLTKLSEAVDKATASTRNLPSYLDSNRIAILENLTNKGYTNGGSSITVNGNIYDSRGFNELTNKATKSQNYNRTGNS